MLRINLLPWREQQRQAALRRLRFMLLGGVVLALCVVLLMDQLARQRAQHHANANLARQAVITELNTQLEQLDGIQKAIDAVRAQTTVLDALYADQELLTTLFTDLERALPEGVQVVELRVEGERLHLAGLAASSAVIAQLMRDLGRSGILLDLELKRIKSMPAGEEFLLLARMSASWS
ncbi:TPA: PilN domain-containing protein [Pseudomonas putida]|jgi:type IV pilus assembly protein PilN|uniref:Fimbrial assembly family protein n=1 Tax=Pseudomonas putida (strain W619) TaxID=390235 RepID=B1J2J1_PSEPW|nr:PilN domain-containing protein [Pseudomonas putida]QQE84481.1 PilN domain-containing protein [Pseudomonas putida]UTL81577.1 PilN domain-containing protein [Pseudomonas putida]HEN8713316.1 PilN domain-containing protein [Pseudomonas putida]HEN8718253.1 PilN domain-containing protein [Pseudomonas putida]